MPSLFSDLGVGGAGIFVTVILAYLLAYLNVVENSTCNRPDLRSLLITSIIPLLFAFAGIIVYESFLTVGLL